MLQEFGRSWAPNSGLGDVHYKVDPKKPDLFGTKQWLCDKTPVCKKGPKIQGFNKAISGGAFLHSGEEKKKGGVMGEDPTYTCVFGSTL